MEEYTPLELCLKTYTSAHIFNTHVTFQPPAIRRGLRTEKSYKSNNPMLQDFEINSVNKCFIGTFKANIIQANKHNICKTRANGAFEFCQEKTLSSPATSGKGFNFTKIIPFILDFIFCHKYLDKLRGNFLVLGIFKIVQNQEK